MREGIVKSKWKSAEGGERQHGEICPPEKLPQPGDVRIRRQQSRAYERWVTSVRRAALVGAGINHSAPLPHHPIQHV